MSLNCPDNSAEKSRFFRVFAEARDPLLEVLLATTGVDVPSAWPKTYRQAMKKALPAERLDYDEA